jgi:hypothetical protein
MRYVFPDILRLCHLFEVVVDSVVRVTDKIFTNIIICLTSQAKALYSMPWTTCKSAVILVQISGFLQYLALEKNRSLRLIVEALFALGNVPHVYTFDII